MTEIDALLKIADAINNLAKAIGGLTTLGIFFLLFKNMGMGTEVASTIQSGLRWISDSIDKIKKIN